MNTHFRPQALALLVGGLLLAVCALFYADVSAQSQLSTVRFVAADGDCGQNGPCYSTLQAAVDAATDGDELRVAAGTYTGVTQRNGSAQLLYLDKSLTILGGYHPQGWTWDPTQHQAILDAQSLGRVVTISGSGAPTLSHLHLVNGAADYGGGVAVDGVAAVLRDNEIYHNRAEGWGGGVYLNNSAATLVANHIYTNTTGPHGRGGGLALSDSPALVDANVIEENHAHVGGGVLLGNTLSQSGAQLTGNTIRNNVAFDLEFEGRTFDGAGGGIDLSSYLTDTLSSNIISGNRAKWGGGIYAFGATAVISENRIQENNAPIHGGGLYVQGGTISLESNQILSNTATNWGGGLLFMVEGGTVRGNTFQGNHTGWRGGGLYAAGNAQFDANLFLDNTADEQGGGIFIYGGETSVYRNTVVKGNHAAEGGGLYLWGTTVQMIHTTITANSSGDGNAVVIDKYPGLVSPGDPTLRTATATFQNGIVTGQPTGFYVTADNTLTLDGILWHAVATHVQAAGASLVVDNEHTGDPLFQADGYHIHGASAARDQGAVRINTDVDGQLRDTVTGAELRADLGADEFVPTALVDPEQGGSLTYVDAQDEITITVEVPPQAVTHTFAIMFSPFPPFPPDVLNSPFGKFLPFGPPFILQPLGVTVSEPVVERDDPPVKLIHRDECFHGYYPDDCFYDQYPAELIARVGLEKMKQMRVSMDRLYLAAVAILSGPFPPPFPPWPPEHLLPPQDPACGPKIVDEDRGTLTTPICNTGIYTETVQATVVATFPVTPNADGTVTLPQGARQASGYQFVFVFVIEVEPSKNYLPEITR